jgi:hypothetical protein
VPTKSFIAMFLIARSVSKWYPELFLIVSVLIYWISFGVFLNPIAIVLLALLFAQLTYKNKILGLVISAILIVLVSWISVKLLSDIIFADTFLWAGVKMLVIGVTYLSITAYYAVILFIKNYSTTADRFPLGSD